MSKVEAHPLGRAPHLGVSSSDLLRGRRVLVRPTEAVVISSMTEVKEATHRHEEIMGSFHRLSHRRRQQIVSRRPIVQFIDGRDQGQPVGDVIVTQATGSILDVGLEVEDSVAMFSMTRACEFRQALDHGLRVTHDYLGNQLVMQSQKQFFTTCQEPAVQKGDREFEIIWIEAIAFTENATRRAETDAEVPYFLGKTAHLILASLLCRAVCEEEQQVDVGEREKTFTAVSANGHQRKTLETFPLLGG